MSDNSITENQINEYYINLKKYVDDYISEDPVNQEVFYVQGRQIATIRYYIQDLINQRFIDTATWGLDYWENEFGITTILTDSYDIRRSRIKARLRGQGTTTVEMIKNICESFSGGLVDVIENNEESYFEIKFISTIGIPEKIEDLYSAIEKIKPAHLEVKYTFTYETWNEIKDFTWWDVSHYTWGQVLNEPIQHYEMNNTNAVVGQAIVGQTVIGEVKFKDLTNAVIGSAIVGYSEIGNDGTD